MALKKCSWCDKSLRENEVRHVIVVAEREGVEEWKNFKLCPDCFNLSTSWKGLYLSRISPGESFGGNDDEQN